MRIRFTRKSKIVTAAVAGAVFGLSGLAAAYWTGGGEGTGNATTASQAAPIIVHQNALPPTIAPGPRLPLSGTFEIGGSNNGVSVGATKLDAKVHPFSVGATLPCTEKDFLIYQNEGGDPPLPIGPLVSNGQAWSGLTLAMTNTGVNQDNCKGVQLTLDYTVS